MTKPHKVCTDQSGDWAPVLIAQGAGLWRTGIWVRDEFGMEGCQCCHTSGIKAATMGLWFLPRSMERCSLLQRATWSSGWHFPSPCMQSCTFCMLFVLVLTSTTELTRTAVRWRLTPLGRGLWVTHTLRALQLVLGWAGRPALPRAWGCAEFPVMGSVAQEALRPPTTRKQQYRPWEEGGPACTLGISLPYPLPSPFFTHKTQLVRPHICDVNVTPSAKLQGCLCNRTLHFQKTVDWPWTFPMVGLVCWAVLFCFFFLYRAVTHGFFA